MKKKSGLIFSIALLGLYGFGCADSNDSSSINECDPTSYVTRCDGTVYQTICLNNIEARVQCSNSCDQTTGKCQNSSPTLTCVQTGCPANQACNQTSGQCENNTQTSCVQTGCNPETEWCNGSTGLCVAKNCQEGAKECRGNAARAVCNTDNFSWEVINCGQNETCSGGECVTNVAYDTTIIEANQGIRRLCPDNTTNCSNNTEYTVNGRVTAIAKAGFFIQTPDCTEPYSGLYIYTSNATITAKLHDDVTVKGKAGAHFGIYQLTAPTITIKSSNNTPVTPVTVSGTDLDSYQSMLVGYKNITISEKTYGEYTTGHSNNTNDPIYKFTTVNGTDLHLGGYSSYTYKMEEPVIGTTYSQANGIMMFEYNKYRIFPRNDADLVVSGVPVVLSGVAASPASAIQGATVTVTVSMNTNVREATTIQISCTSNANCPSSTSIAAGSKEATFTFTMPEADVKVTATLGEVSKDFTVTYDNGTLTTVTETFDGTFTNDKTSNNKTCAVSSYCSGKFKSSKTNLTWNYHSLRTDLQNNGNNYSIDGNGIMLYRKDNAASNISTTIATGMKSVSLQAKQAFTGGSASDRKIKISVNGTACVEHALTSSTEVETISCTGLSPAANSVLLIESTGSKQVTIDNVSWTY